MTLSFLLQNVETVLRVTSDQCPTDTEIRDTRAKSRVPHVGAFKMHPKNPNVLFGKGDQCLDSSFTAGISLIFYFGEFRNISRDSLFGISCPQTLATLQEWSKGHADRPERLLRCPHETAVLLGRGSPESIHNFTWHNLAESDDDIIFHRFPRPNSLR